jgi:hypothetical protein
MKQFRQAIFILLAGIAMASWSSNDVKWPVGVTAYYPNSSAFENATVRWNAYGSPNFTSAVSPTTAEEVAEIVRQLVVGGT